MNDDVGKTYIRQSGSPVTGQDTGPFAPPAKVGPYVLGRVLGRGGMAVVFHATDPAQGRDVALKLMMPQLGSDAVFVSRFLQEGRSSVELAHPHIVRTYEFGQDAGWYFIACELVEGGTVAELLQRAGTLPPPVAAEVMAQMLEGLVHAHGRGVVHRDLKPENLLLASSGQVKLSDFGIARAGEQTRLTSTGMLLGTAEYMSPEQARGEVVDERSDLFSAGSVFYELLAGQSPFRTENPTRSLTRIVSGTFMPIFEANPSVPPELEAVLEGLLAQGREARFPSAQAALDALSPYLAPFREREPELLARFLAEPETSRAQHDDAQRAQWVSEAEALLSGTPLERNRAAYKLSCALALRQDDAAALAALERLRAHMPVAVGPSSNPKVHELEAELSRQTSVQTLTKLAQLYKLEGNVLKAAAHLRRYLKLRPQDAYAANQLFQLSGEQRLGVVSRPVADVGTRELVAGVKTGGLKVEPAVVVAPTPSDPTVSSVDLPAVPTHNPLWGALIKLATVAALVGLAVLGFRKVSGWIDSASQSQLAQADELRRNLEAAHTSGPAAAPVQAELDRLAQRNDERARALLDEADALERLGHKVAAEERYTRLLTEFPKRPQASVALLRRAKLWLSETRWAEARVGFSEFLALHGGSPEAAEALLRRGEAALRDQDPGPAEADFNTFLRDHPSSALVVEAWLLRAELRLKRRDVDGAKADLREVLGRRSSGDPLWQRASALLAELEPPARVDPKKVKRGPPSRR